MLYLNIINYNNRTDDNYKTKLEFRSKAKGYSYIQGVFKTRSRFIRKIARDLKKISSSNKNNGVKLLKTEQMKKLQTLVLIIAPSYFIGRLLIGLIFNI